jgi:two-component system chemotaxis sensor kinase CheA
VPSKPLYDLASKLAETERSQRFDASPPGGEPAAPSTPPVDPSPDPCVTLVEDADLSIIADFIVEAREYLDASEAALLHLEGNPDDAEAINTVFRAFHTIKGTSSFLGLDLITTLAHDAESLLSRVRDREIRCTGGYAGLALRAVDVMATLLDGVKVVLAGKLSEPIAGYRMVVSRLRDPEAFGISELERRAAWRAFQEGAPTPDVGGVLDNPIVAIAPRVASHATAAASVVRPVTPNDRAAPALPATDRFSTDAMDATVRVRITRLDRLIEIVGELAISHSMLLQDPAVRDGANPDLACKIAQSENTVRELQSLGLGMRMVPLRVHFQKVARLVRDLAHKGGKLVTFVGHGEDTEIDRTLVDILGDPLIHMVRNSLDHGIELPDRREAIGKSRTGVVRLSAYHAGGNVIVELHDDGHGLDRERIVEKAVEKGIIPSGDGMSDADVFRLIFAPGFSTAERVTDVSGRGVGMDVVKRNVERARGRVDIASAPGIGTKFTLRLPVTLAITDGMLVRVGSERYLVPASNVHLTFQPERRTLSTVGGRGEMLTLRDEVLPLLRLHRLFGISDAVTDPALGLIMVVGDGVNRAALLVDELLGQQRVVAKTLGDGIGSVPGVSGGAVLGDGRVGLILDVQELAALARVGDAQSPAEASAARAVA